MTKYINQNKETLKLEKSFGAVFFVLFSLLGFYPIVKGESINYWFLIIALAFIFFTIFSPRRLSIPSRLWIELGVFLSTIFAPIIMTLVYVITIIPIGLIFKLIGKDMLHKKFNENSQTYWIKRNQHLRSMKDQY